MITCVSNIKFCRKVVYQCENCGEPIREGDAYYAIGGEAYCENCVERARNHVDYLPEEDDDYAESF